MKDPISYGGGMARLRRTLLTAAVAGAVHAAPGLTNVDIVRRALFPGLSGVGAPGHVAVTFDDGPQPESTPAFLEALDRLGWKATFFMLGSMVARSPALAAEVAAAGHEIAVHGYTHRSEMFRTLPAVHADMARAVATISDATGRELHWFRPPYGTLSAGGVVAARRQRLRTVLWSTWGRDWRAEATPATVVADVKEHLGPGATVLLHDSDCTSAPGAWRSALGALEPLAELFAERGLQAGTLGAHGLVGAVN